MVYYANFLVYLYATNGIAVVFKRNSKSFGLLAIRIYNFRHFVQVASVRK
jgi:hypothetical protein